jgi:hypothetical protein
VPVSDQRQARADKCRDGSARRACEHLNGGHTAAERLAQGTGGGPWRDYSFHMATRLSLLVLLLAAAVAAAAAPSSPPARTDHAALVAGWKSQGLQQASSREFDLLYVRPGVISSAGPAVEVAPVTVELDPDWQRANLSLYRARMRPAEVQRLKDEVALIVANELKQQLAGLHAGGEAAAPVLEARVLDLYLNAPDMQTAVAARTYSRSFGEMVLVAELRDQRGGALLFGAWDYRPAREFATLRLTTRVENAIEVRAAAHAWARQLRREIDRLGSGG